MKTKTLKTLFDSQFVRTDKMFKTSPNCYQRVYSVKPGKNNNVRYYIQTGKLTETYYKKPIKYVLLTEVEI